jgi:hypothetical protein
MSANFLHPRTGVAPEFVKEVEDELSHRLGQPVTMMLGHGIVAVGTQQELFAGESVAVMEADPLLLRKRPAEWADAFERKINRLSGKVKDVEQLYAEIQKSPAPVKTGEIVLEHISDYDDDFFEALASVISHDKSCLDLSRVRDLQALQEYLRIVCRRARNGEMAAMRRELAQGAAQEADLGGPQ